LKVGKKGVLASGLLRLLLMVYDFCRQDDFERAAFAYF
jgi:hypothetical protein